MRLLLLANLDSQRPFGQFGRPFFFGRALSERGFDVGVVGVDCERVDYGPRWSTGTQSLRAFVKACRQAVAEFRPDVVYAHQNMPATAALLAARGVPVAADFHSLPSVEWSIWARYAEGGERRRYRLNHHRAAIIERFVAGRADLAVAAGRQVGEELEARYRLRRAPVVVVNGVEEAMLDEPGELDVPEPLTAPGGHALAVLPAAAWPSNQRGLEFLVEAAGALSRVAPGAMVHVVGTASGEATPGLRYEGVQPSVVPWIAHADACLLPYPAAAGHCGGARTKLVEYLARGRTIVTTAEGLRGFEEAADWEGVVVTSDDPEDYAAQLARVLADGGPRLAEDRALVRERLRWDRLADELVPVLSELASGATAARGNGHRALA